MKKNLLSQLLLFICTASFAQIDFEKGYFISNNGARTVCFIENADWRSNPTVFNYKLPASEEKKVQNIIGVKEFGIDNVSMYKRYTVKIERSQNETGLLLKNKAPEWKEETLFLQALVTGEASLFSYTDGNVTKFFYETKQNPIEQLVYVRYISNDLNNSGIDSFQESIKENNQFRQQLLNHVKCANTTDGSFKNIEYQKNQLVKHFVAYNSCYADTAKNMNYSAKDDNREKFSLRFTPGVYMASLSISDPNNFYNMSTDMKQTIFRIGLDIEYIFPFNKGHWSIFTNPSYQKFDAKESFTKVSLNYNGNNPINYNATIDYSSVELPIGIRRYFFLSPSSKIYANAALVIDVMLSSDQTVEFTNTNNLPNATKSLPLSSRNSMLIGLGYSYKRFSGEIRYYTQKELSNILSWNAKYSSFGLTVGYKIL